MVSKSSISSVKSLACCWKIVPSSSQPSKPKGVSTANGDEQEIVEISSW
jgi:hypothetical protein